MNAIEDCARSIFLAAFERAPDQWPAYLNEACGGDVELRARAEKLLHAHDAMGSILGGNSVAALEDWPVAERPGTMIGPYKLTEQIGEGGMGIVFLAQQEHPIKRKVAIKIVKPGMDTREVIARFEAERQALALMDHPNIAKVFDAGAVGHVRQPFQADDGAKENDGIYRDARQPGKTDVHSGRPYFVMELVQGVPITEYCDQCHLTTRDRLELFVTVCRAVQHAHQKGIIHRDIKPTNVLVAMQDDRPTPKIIDFGVAKAIDGRLTDRTLTSGFAQMLGTPLYMSPEQAELSPLGVDTRSDVYSLGVLLYELLTGATPFDKDRLYTAPYDEIRRIIREEEPPRPSTRISTLAAGAATTVAEHRRTDTRRLVQTVRGELDWIVMKALDKDRNRRYDSPNDLARDVEQFFADEPINARPVSRAYRANKFVRKHPMGVFAAAAVLLALTAGSVLSSMGLALALKERDRALANLHGGCALIDDMAHPIYWEIANAPGLDAVRVTLLEKSLEFYASLDEEARRDPTVRHGWANALTRLAHSLNNQGRDSTDAARRALELLDPLAREYPHNTRYVTSFARALMMVGHSHADAFQWRWAEPEYAKAVAVLGPLVAANPTDGYAHWRLIQSCTEHGKALYQLGRLDEAESQLSQAVASAAKAFPPDEWTKDRRLFESMARFYHARGLIDRGRYTEAAFQLAEAQRIADLGVAEAPNAGNRRLFTAWAHYVPTQVGVLKVQLGNADAAVQILTRTIESLAGRGDGLPDSTAVQTLFGDLHHRRAEAHAALSNFEESKADYEKSMQFWKRPNSEAARYAVALAHWRIGELDYAQGRALEADSHFAEAIEEFETLAGDRPNELFAHQSLIVFLCSCPIPAFRDPGKAVRLAEQFVTPSNGPMWLYLGLARYRAGDSAGAEDAIRKSMELRSDGDALDLLILTGAQAKLGNLDRARETYVDAVQAIARKKPRNYGDVSVITFQHLQIEIQQLISQSTKEN